MLDQEALLLVLLPKWLKFTPVAKWAKGCILHCSAQGQKFKTNFTEDILRGLKWQSVKGMFCTFKILLKNAGVIYCTCCSILSTVQMWTSCRYFLGPSFPILRILQPIEAWSDFSSPRPGLSSWIWPREYLPLLQQHRPEKHEIVQNNPSPQVNSKGTSIQ